MDAEEEASQSEGREDVIFWNLLYRIDPDLKGFYWIGQKYESLPALGKDMLERLWKGDQSNYPYWDSILENKLLTNYLKILKSNNTKLAVASDAIETSHKICGRNKRDILLDYYTMAYLLSGQKLLYINNKKLNNLKELITYLKQLLDSSYKEFEILCHRLIDNNDTLDVQFEAWIIAQGKRKELDLWKRELN